MKSSNIVGILKLIGDLTTVLPDGQTLAEYLSISTVLDQIVLDIAAIEEKNASQDEKDAAIELVIEGFQNSVSSSLGTIADDISGINSSISTMNDSIGNIATLSSSVSNQVDDAAEGFDSLKARFESITGDSLITQLVKLGVLASITEPKEIQTTIPYNENFSRLPVSVLKFTSGSGESATTLVGFNNNDAADFIEDEQVVFDGTMQLKTLYSTPMNFEKDIDTGKMWSIPLDPTKFKTIKKLEVV